MTASHIGMMNLIVGLVLIGISIPLVLRKIPMNWWYGIRTREAFESDDNWYAINAHGSKWMIACGIILAAIGALALSVDIQDQELLTMFEYAPFLILLTLIPIVIYSKTL
ncbi:MAG: SdpI family protein [Candidatus Coatesbacteria bacterium]|nr:SdpI family protein [Candidatus Coatesbacteria bacterium]